MVFDFSDAGDDGVNVVGYMLFEFIFCGYLGIEQLRYESSFEISDLI